MTGRLKLTGQVLAVALVAALLGLLVWKVSHGSGKTSQPKNFDLPRLDRSGKLELASLKGKVVVLNFWASWCGPCKQEAPMVEQVWRQFRSKGVIVVGVDTKDFSGDARSFMRRYGLTYPVVRDGDGALWGPYGLTGVPETRLIDRQGKYAGTQFYGAVSAAQLKSGIEQALRA
jgi:cytochrome c biogenesis protein CcmG, thiol:disulfide interchange protein DsbE